MHLGWTAYGPPWWGTSVNPACKLALLGHAFDDCGFGRVKLQTDLINTRSQAAIAKLGATREGVLRRHHPPGRRHLAGLGASLDPGRRVARRARAGLEPGQRPGTSRAQANRR